MRKYTHRRKKLSEGENIIIEPLKQFEIFKSKGVTERILAVGDFRLNSSKAQGMFGRDILQLLHDKELSLANLECPVSSRGIPIPKTGANLASSEQTIEALKLGKFDVAVLANNHIMDFGEEALTTTISLCQKSGIKTVGAGANLDKSYQPVLFDLKQSKVAILAFAQEEFSSAGETTAGTAKLEPTSVWRAIRQTKAIADVVIVSVHGGVELYPLPSPKTYDLYHFIVECGADAVIGHHPHILQGVEIYRGAPIIYSLGNFAFEFKQKIPACWSKGLIARLVINDKRIAALDIFGSTQMLDKNKNVVSVDVLPFSEYALTTNRFERLCQISANPGLVNEFWKCFCVYKESEYITLLKSCLTSLSGKLKDLAKCILRNKLPFYPFNLMGDCLNKVVRSKKNVDKDILLLRNLLVCPAHHEILSSIFEMKRLNIAPRNEIWQEFENLMRD